MGDARTLAGAKRPIVERATPLSAVGPAPRAVAIERAGAPRVDVSLVGVSRLVVGRHAAADVAFASAEVSRLHGVIRVEGDAVLYEDLGSENGTVLERAGTATAVAAREAVRVLVDDALTLGTPDARVVFVEKARPSSSARAASSTNVSAAAQAFEARLEIAARTRVPVFLLGASGSGKTHAAARIHTLSGAEGPLVALNCARLPHDPSALHSELLGHVKGAFTGADQDRAGKLLQADGGTLFLDEVESLGPLAQGFLLDVLEGTGDLSPLGARRLGQRAPLFRLISASKKPLASSGLRPDLAERLAEGHLWRIPSLDERRDDIPGLIAAFADEEARLLGVGVDVTAAFVAVALDASWPGQVRQLKAALVVLAETALAEARGGTRAVRLDAPALEEHLRARAVAFGDEDTVAPKSKADARALTREQLRHALEVAGGNISKAARALGIARGTLAKKAAQLGLGGR